MTRFALAISLAAFASACAAEATRPTAPATPLARITASNLKDMTLTVRTIHADGSLGDEVIHTLQVSTWFRAGPAGGCVHLPEMEPVSCSDGRHADLS